MAWRAQGAYQQRTHDAHRQHGIQVVLVRHHQRVCVVGLQRQPRDVNAVGVACATRPKPLVRDPSPGTSAYVWLTSSISPGM